MVRLVDGAKVAYQPVSMDAAVWQQLLCDELGIAGHDETAAAIFDGSADSLLGKSLCHDE